MDLFNVVLKGLSVKDILETGTTDIVSIIDTIS